jgi:tRNA (guanosine-2'-O-)-methyltransferase
VTDCYALLREEGFRVYATRLGVSSASLYDLDLSRPSALVFGNEHRGVSVEAAEGADGIFHIPMVGMIQSLNVSVAAAVSLYEAHRQRVAAGAYRRIALGADELTRLYDDWSRR